MKFQTPMLIDTPNLMFQLHCVRVGISYLNARLSDCRHVVDVDVREEELRSTETHSTLITPPLDVTIGNHSENFPL